MNLYNMYIILIQIHMHKLQLKKIKMWGVKEILWKDHW